MCSKGSASLLQLPDSCLVAVLRCCAGDSRSVCSAARAHSRLRHAAAEVITSKSLTTDDQQRLDSLQLYLSQLGQQFSTLNLQTAAGCCKLALRELPCSLHLSSLTCESVLLQLQPGSGYQGVLGGGAAPPLKQLRLTQCMLSDPPIAVSAALAQLTDLEHLSISAHVLSGRELLELHALQQLTFLELADVSLPTAAVQRLSALTRLVDLRLQGCDSFSVSASALSGLLRLTHLQLAAVPGRVRCEPAALSGKSQLQHLELCKLDADGGAAGAGQLLAHVGELQQLTHLSVRGSLHQKAAQHSSMVPAAAYSALTASSKLELLDITSCSLSAHAWEHILPAGKKLPHLQTLAASCTPDVSRLTSYCPGLQSLRVGRGAQVMVAVRSTSGLQWLPLSRCASGWRHISSRPGVS